MTCDGNMKDDALFQQGARTVRFDMTVSLPFTKDGDVWGSDFCPREDQAVPSLSTPALEISSCGDCTWGQRNPMPPMSN